MKTLFEKNIKFFYNRLPAYYTLITSIKKKNFLIKDSNIIDSNGGKIYPSSIEKDSRILASDPLNNRLWHKHYFFIEPVSWDENEFPHTGKAVNNLITQFKKASSYKQKDFLFQKNFLPATVILGLLSGRHLQILVENYDFHSLFIYEPNPEFFAISLYFVDYEKIYKKLEGRFFLWVNAKLDYFAVEKFFYERTVTSNFLQLTLKTYDHPLIHDAHAKFEQIRAAKTRGWGTFEDELKGVENHYENIQKRKLYKPPQKKPQLPVCVIANGKSLEKNFTFIKQNAESMILISVGTALKPLLAKNINPDFHIEQERIDILPEILKDSLPRFKGVFIGASVVNPAVFEMSKKSLIYIREGFSLNKELQLKGSSPIVGNAGLAFASTIGKEIYLCGMDLGFRLHGKKHASQSYYDDKNDTVRTGIKIEGNFSDDIYTDSLFLSSKRKMEHLIKTENLEVYNLSDGAYINNTTPLKFKTLPKINKKPLIEKVLNSACTIEKPQKPALKEILKLIDASLNRPVKDIKELTGIVDFLEDIFKSNINNPSFALLKGSLFHYLNYLYILSHKVEDIGFLKHRFSEFFPPFTDT